MDIKFNYHLILFTKSHFAMFFIRLFVQEVWENSFVNLFDFHKFVVGHQASDFSPFD